MTDLLIRDLPAELLGALDARAARLGISRNEYVRRRLTQDAVGATAAVSVRDLLDLGGAITDLGDDTVMAAAWR